MKLNIEELKQSAGREVVIEFDELIPDINNESPVKAELTATIEEYGIKIEGNIKTNVTLQCDRCLKNFDFVVNIDIDEKFINGILVSDEVKEFQIKNDNFLEDLKNTEEIDITDLVYQSVILNLPMQKLCSKNCKGTTEYQDHQKEEKIDPRLEIFKQMSENNIKKEN